MSHKLKNVTWYSLMLRIQKMRVTNAQTQVVQVKIGDTLYPLDLEYDDNGELAYLKLKDDVSTNELAVSEVNGKIEETLGLVEQLKQGLLAMKR